MYNSKLKQQEEDVGTATEPQAFGVVKYFFRKEFGLNIDHETFLLIYGFLMCMVGEKPPTKSTIGAYAQLGHDILNFERGGVVKRTARKEQHTGLTAESTVAEIVGASHRARAAGDLMGELDALELLGEYVGAFDAHHRQRIIVLNTGGATCQRKRTN